MLTNHLRCLKFILTWLPMFIISRKPPTTKINVDSSISKKKKKKNILKRWVLRSPASSPLWRMLWFSFCFPKQCTAVTSQTYLCKCALTQLEARVRPQPPCLQNVDYKTVPAHITFFTVVIVTIVLCVTGHLIGKDFSCCLHESLMFCILPNSLFYLVTDSCLLLGTICWYFARCLITRSVC